LPFLAELIAESFLKKKWRQYFAKLLTAQISSKDGPGLSLLALQLDAYVKCVEKTGREELCTDYLPAISYSKQSKCAEKYNEALYELRRSNKLEPRRLNELAEELVKARIIEGRKKDDLSLVIGITSHCLIYRIIHNLIN
jgi:hypothetical protein